MSKMYFVCDDYTDRLFLDFFGTWCQEETKQPLVIINRTPQSAEEIYFEPNSPVIFAPGHADNVSTPDLLEAVINHVVDGGSLLMVAGGMMSRRTHEWHLLSSARVLRVQPFGEVSVEKADHPLTVNFEALQYWDEAIFFERSVFDNSELLVNMKLGSKLYPTVWTRPWYKGRIYCFGSMLSKSVFDAYVPLLRSVLNQMTEER